MLLHDWAVLRENWEVGLSPSHPHQLSGRRRSPAEQAAPSPRASPPAQGPPDSADHEARVPVTMSSCPCLLPGRAGMGHRRGRTSHWPASKSEREPLASERRQAPPSARMLASGWTAWNWRSRILILVFGPGWWHGTEDRALPSPQGDLGGNKIALLAMSTWEFTSGLLEPRPAYL